MWVPDGVLFWPGARWGSAVSMPRWPTSQPVPGTRQKRQQRPPRCTPSTASLPTAATATLPPPGPLLPPQLPSRWPNMAAEQTGKTNLRNVAYFFDEELCNYNYGGGNPMRPHRHRLTSNLVRGYGLEEKLQIIRPRARTRDEIMHFHADGERLWQVESQDVVLC